LPRSPKMPIFKALKWSLACGDLYLNNAFVSAIPSPFRQGCLPG
jgi:hypothetical protein